MALDGNALLAAYDEQLRTNAEVHAAMTVRKLGPLLLATFAGGNGFVTYRDLDGAAADIRALVASVVNYFRGRP